MKIFTVCLLLSLPTIAYSQADCPPNAVTCKVEILKNGGTSTSSTVATSNTAAVVGAELGSAAVLAYFIEIRPTLQRIHNEKINAIEGQFQEEYRALDDLITTDAPSSANLRQDISVHGYKLGESWDDFVSASPLLQANIEKCMKQSPPKQTAKHQVYDPCRDVRYMHGSGAGKIILPCRASEKAKNIMCRDFNGEVTFVDGQIAALKIILPHTSLADAVSKFGPVSGADKEGTSEIWHGQQYAAAADRMVDGIGLLWENPSQFSATLEIRKDTSDAMASGSSVEPSSGANF